ncbi:MAG: V-type ATPase subunit [Oscillospiraceae bacterium]|nr:V-type ATPase subunit [Oscillospiraceae bacterium]
MILSYASNAVLSKARAMYGKRLKERDYLNLMSCDNVSEIASYLKHKTLYFDILSAINENDIHRGYLEDIIKRKLFYDFAALGKYDLSSGEHFFSYIITKTEIQEIIHIIMLLAAGKTNEYFYSMPIFLVHHTKIDINAFSSIKSFDDLLEATKKSVYNKMLMPFRPRIINEPVDISQIEAVLYTYLYDLIFHITDKYTKGKTKAELNNLFNTYVDLSNIVRITRVKKFYHVNDEYIETIIFPFGTLGMKTLRGYIYSKDHKQMMVDMKNSKVGKKWLSKGVDTIDKIPKYMRFIRSLHNIRFSVSPQIVLMSYIFLKEIEILNIINIIEGVRYKLPPDEIKAMIIQ